MNNDIIKKEDYEEPECPIITRGHKSAVPMSRIMKKLDGYLGKNDFAGAQRLLQFWLEEAGVIGDKRGQICIYNEMLCLLRKTEQKNKAYDAAENTLKLIDELEIGETVNAGTAYINIAAVYQLFDDIKKALSFYKKAETIYNEVIEKTDKSPEAAVIYLNKAYLYEMKLGLEEAEEEISKLLQKASELLDSPAVLRDRHYAHVCEKCAPVFGYYGYFLYENELKKRAEEIFAGQQ